MKTSRIGTVFAFVISAAFVVAAVWLFFNRQYAQDWISVQGFTPSQSIATINDRAEFTDKGEFIFYATRPQVENQETFNKECPRQEAGSPILGCYTTDDRIYIYNLTNDRLDGMEEVTAVSRDASRCLVSYKRRSERERLTTLLKSAYDKVDDAELKTRMRYYQH